MIRAALTFVLLTLAPAAGAACFSGPPPPPGASGVALFPAYDVGTHSMLPALRDTDCAAIRPLDPGEVPEPGQVVLYVPPVAPWVIRPAGLTSDHPHVGLGTFLRIVATEGQRIRFEAGRLLVDDTALGHDPVANPGSLGPQDYLGEARPYACLPPETAHCPNGIAVETLPNGTRYLVAEPDAMGGLYHYSSEITVPPGHVYLMADNRAAPGDHRIPRVGPGLVPVANLQAVVTRPEPWLTPPPGLPR